MHPAINYLLLNKQNNFEFIIEFTYETKANNRLPFLDNMLNRSDEVLQ